MSECEGIWKRVLPFGKNISFDSFTDTALNQTLPMIVMQEQTGEVEEYMCLLTL